MHGCLVGITHRIPNLFAEGSKSDGDSQDAVAKNSNMVRTPPIFLKNLIGNKKKSKITTNQTNHSLLIYISSDIKVSISTNTKKNNPPQPLKG